MVSRDGYSRDSDAVALLRETKCFCRRGGWNKRKQRGVFTDNSNLAEEPFNPEVARCRELTEDRAYK
jgi:hypothetical protein